MNKGNLNAPYWFDQWTRQAEMRRARRRRVADLLSLIASVTCIAGLFMMLMGVAWIDAMDICAQNVTLSFLGVALMAIGARTKYAIEGGELI